MAPTTQLQAMPALVCLDTRVPNHAMKGYLDALCADEKPTVPMAMTREAARRAFGHSRHGQLMVKLVSQ